MRLILCGTDGLKSTLLPVAGLTGVWMMWTSNKWNFSKGIVLFVFLLLNASGLGRSRPLCHILPWQSALIMPWWFELSAIYGRRLPPTWQLIGT